MIFVGAGGVFGSITRYYLGKVITQRSKHTLFPIGTFIINLSGAMLLGLVAGIDVSRNINMLIADGFFGRLYDIFHVYV
ncbi:MAG: CrcB family protein [Burkholderiales bacterium]